MSIVFHSLMEFLGAEGFASPELHVLVPNHENYSVLLFQPNGDIEVDSDGVRNANPTLAKSQHVAFLTDAALGDVTLAITPEYSTPWGAVEHVLRMGVHPAEGSLWVIGCESIKLAELNEFKERVAGVANVLYESLVPHNDRFLDPVLYVFLTRRLEGDAEPQPMIVVQFKTLPMADPDHWENNGLQRGTRIYFLGGKMNRLRLVTLICSDALMFTDRDAFAIYDRTLVLHIQLNPKPRHAQFRQYRERLMQFNGDQTEVICVNWAKDVCEKRGNVCECWNNISGTAWYLRPDGFDDRDATLITNHKLGLYYTWIDDLRCRALFFNYMPGVFAVTSSKVAHIGVLGVSSRRSGPKLSAVRRWDNVTHRWVDDATCDDGFSSIVHESGDAKGDLLTLAGANPFAVERVLALTAGKISHYEWHEVNQLDSCRIAVDEIVNRVTVYQDPDASPFRIERLRTAQRVVAALKASPPSALADLAAGFKMSWSEKSPHTNIVSASQKRATAIYLGEHSMPSIQQITAYAEDNIGRWETDKDAIVDGKQRLSVWYRNEAGADVQFEPNHHVAFDETRTESPFDIAREV